MSLPYTSESSKEEVKRPMERGGEAPGTDAESSSEDLEHRLEKGTEGISAETLLEKAKRNAQTTVTPTDGVAVQSDANAITIEEDDITRVNKLVALAKEKGVAHAFEVALKVDDLYVLDQLHDTLSGKLYDELIAEGILKGRE